DGWKAVAPWLELAARGNRNLTAPFLRATFGMPPKILGSSQHTGLDDFPPGDYSITAHLKDYVPSEQALHLEGGGEQIVELELIAAGQATGRVLVDGKPYANAKVALLFTERSDDIFGFTLDLFRSHGVFPSNIPEDLIVTTDTDGKFSIRNAKPGSYQVLIHAKDYLPTIQSPKNEILARQSVDLGDFDLALGFGLELVVRNRDGENIEGVEVQWTRVSTNSLMSLRRNQRAPVAQTDAEGRVFFGGLPSERITLTLVHDDYARHTEEYDFAGRTGRGTDLLEITLIPGASIAGKIMDGSSGAAVAGAEIELFDAAASDEFLAMFGEATWEARSAEDGAFHFSRLPAGEYIITAKHDEFSETQYGPFMVEETAVEDITIMLHRGATLHVKVLDSEGIPVSDASVNALNSQSQIAESATTDMDGIATLPPLAAGNYQVTFTDLAGFNTTDNTGSLDVAMKFVTLEDYEERTLVIGGIVPRADLEGEVRRAGELMASATIAIITDSGVKVGIADKQGWYEVKGVPLGTYTYTVTAGTPLRGGSTIFGLLELTSEGTVRKDIEMPLEGIEVHVTEAGSGKDLANLPVAMRPMDGTNIQGGTFGLTNNDGVLELGSLEPGQYILSVGNLAAVFLAGGDAGLGSKQISPIEIREGSGIQRFEVQLDQGATFRVRVRDSNGNLLKGVHMHYLDSNGQIMNILSTKGTNSKGVAELSGLPSGPGIILIRHPNLGATEIPVDLSAGTLTKREATLKAGTRVYVTPTDADGNPMSGILVTALDSRGAPASFAWSQAETQATNAAFFSGGEQKVGPLLPGEYQIQLYRPGKAPVRHRITVGGQEEMHLRLPYSSDQR
ncbi:MAG: carboxypeptidase regulatory-like domain-containing protein, partial [Planctomycetota bacterium]